jgi:hypothetical protein
MFICGKATKFIKQILEWLIETETVQARRIEEKVNFIPKSL